MQKPSISPSPLKRLNLYNFLIFTVGCTIGFFSFYFGSFLGSIDSQDDSNTSIDLLSFETANITSNCTKNVIPKPYVKWNSKVDRYLVATCTLGQLSHRITCFKKTLMIASVLNRTLIIPEEDLHPLTYSYRYGMAIDFAYARYCLGNNILTVKEFIHTVIKKKKLKINRVMCLFPHCGWPNNYHKKWNSITLPKAAEDFSNVLDKNVTLQTILSNFGNVRQTVVTLGDLFHIDYFFDYNELVPIELRENGKCKLIIKPQISIFKTARAFIRQILGSNFAAVHLQQKYLREDRTSTKALHAWSMHDVAECLHHKLTSLNITTVFVISDSSKDELTIGKKMLSNLGVPISNIFVVTLSNLTNLKLASYLNSRGWADDPTARITLKKVIASFSSVFIGSFSVFSEEINEMRSLLGLSTCNDEYVCQNNVWEDPVPKSFNEIIAS